MPAPSTAFRFSTLYVLAGFVLFAAIWFGLKRGSVADAIPAPPTNPKPAHAETAVEAFQPDRNNVDPSTHSQIETLRLRLAESPDDTTHLLQFARLLQDAHQPEEAARHYRHYLALRPNNRQAWLDLTQTYGERGRWDDALEAVDAMLARYPDDPSGLYNRGAILANTSRFEDARAVWTKVAGQIDDPGVAAMARQSLNKLPPAP
jgi:predicted Zn-dependent protease